MTESKYPAQYWSESKQEHIPIENMVTPHLINAWRKLAPANPLRPYMEQELRARSGTLDAEGKWTFPTEVQP